LQRDNPPKTKMDIEHYNNIYTYLLQQKYPDNFSNQQKQTLVKQSTNYIIKNNFIYKKDKRKQNHLLRVIRKH